MPIEIHNPATRIATFSFNIRYGNLKTALRLSMKYLWSKLTAEKVIDKYQINVLDVFDLLILSNSLWMRLPEPSRTRHFRARKWRSRRKDVIPQPGTGIQFHCSPWCTCTDVTKHTWMAIDFSLTINTSGLVSSLLIYVDNRPWLK